MPRVESLVHVLQLVLAIVALVMVGLHLGNYIALTESVFGSCCVLVGWASAPPAQLVAMGKAFLGQLRAGPKV